MVGQWIVGLAFFLHTSPRYRHYKKFFYNLLENSAYPYKKYFDYFMMSLIVISVYILIRHVKHEMSEGWLFFNSYVISLIFFMEYMLRMWIYSDLSKIVIDQYEHDLFLQRSFSFRKALHKSVVNKAGYVFSLSAIIDLLAIMPFFHELRMLRIFILFRVFKLFRYTKSLTQFVSILSSKKFEIFTLGLFATVIIVVSSVLIYIMEANNPESRINTLFDAVYWSVVTIFTVGYGDFVPVTDEGRTVAMVIIFAGIAVISFATSIVVSAFTEKLDEIKEEKLIDDVSKLDRFYIICGYSSLSHEVAQRFLKSGKKVIILEKENTKVLEAQKYGFKALAMDSSSLSTYQTLKVNFEQQVESVLLFQESDVLNVYTALTVRELSASIKILSVLNQVENRRKLLLAGISEIVYTQELIGLMSKQVSGKPIAFDVINELRAEKSGVYIEEIVLDKYTCDRFFDIAHLPLFQNRLIVFGVYKTFKKVFFFNPRSNLVIDSGDVAIVIGTRALINEFKAMIYKKGNR
ncbi:ion transporter [Sulfuricurvum sp.]|uniref:ion transporter n=1 Tax=Sulfuricurvum sp. TaxID=2025608 RepID=UPI003BAF199F